MKMKIMFSSSYVAAARCRINISAQWRSRFIFNQLAMLICLRSSFVIQIFFFSTLLNFIFLCSWFHTSLFSSSIGCLAAALITHSCGARMKMLLNEDENSNSSRFSAAAAGANCISDGRRKSMVIFLLLVCFSVASSPPQRRRVSGSHF